MKKDEKKCLCVRCITEEVSTTNNNPSELLTEQKTRAEMTEELASTGTTVRLSDDIHDVIDLYEAIVNSKQAVYTSETLMQSITIPAEPSTYLESIERISKFEMRNGGRYVTDHQLSERNKIEITCLLAELVNINNSQSATEHERTIIAKNDY